MRLCESPKPRKKFFDLMFLSFFFGCFFSCVLSIKLYCTCSRMCACVNVCVCGTKTENIFRIRCHIFFHNGAQHSIIWEFDILWCCFLLLLLQLQLFLFIYLCDFFFLFCVGCLRVNFWSIWRNLFQFATFLVCACCRLLLLQFQFVVITQKLLNYINLVRVCV